MHFQDLEPCRYHDGPFDSKNWRAPLLAVGWLEHPHSYRQGAAPERLPECIRTLRHQATEAFLEFAFMGLHACSLCASNDSDVRVGLRGSSMNLFVPGRSVVYCSPGAVDHYIEAHSYLPPSEFIEAVFECPDPRSPEYRQALRTANVNVEAPLWR